MMLAGYDYIVLGLLVVAVLVVVMQRKSGLTHVILGSYLMIILALGLYRSIDTWISSLVRTPDVIGLFLVRYGSLASFLANSKLWIIGVIIGFFGWQMMHGSSLGALSSRHVTYRVWQALELPLAVIGIWALFMLIWAGPAFFTTGLSVWSAKMFSDPLIRQVVKWLPGILTAHVFLSALATTIFSAFIDVSFRVGRKSRERDAIYVERDEPIRHVVE